MADEPVIEEPPKPPEPPVYKHSLSGHAVSGDGTFEETKASTATDDYRQEKLPEFSDFAKAVSGEKEEEEKPLEPLPEIPKMPMTVDDAYDFLQVKKEDRGNLDKVRHHCTAAATRAQRGEACSVGRAGMATRRCSLSLARCA